MISVLRNYPSTLVVTTLALLVWAVPSLGSLLETNFALIGEGQWWRIWTGHLVHFDGGHLFWDLMMFVALGSVCERQHPRLFPIAWFVLATGVTLGLAMFCDGIGSYRGLSGIDTGLFVWLASERVFRSCIDRERVTAFAWLLALIGLTGKLVFETVTGQTLFVDSSGFTPLVEAHLAGVMFGFICSLIVFASARDEEISLDERFVRCGK
ncbi:MAG: rhombosortase [Planctomycetota bacterium]